MEVETLGRRVDHLDKDVGDLKILATSTSAQVTSMGVQLEANAAMSRAQDTKLDQLLASSASQSGAKGMIDAKTLIPLFVAIVGLVGFGFTLLQATKAGIDDDMESAQKADAIQMEGINREMFYLDRMSEFRHKSQDDAIRDNHLERKGLHDEFHRFLSNIWQPHAEDQAAWQARLEAEVAENTHELDVKWLRLLPFLEEWGAHKARMDLVEKAK